MQTYKEKKFGNSDEIVTFKFQSIIPQQLSDLSSSKKKELKIDWEYLRVHPESPKEEELCHSVSEKLVIESSIARIVQELDRERQNCGCPSILCAEDDEFIRFVTKTNLEALGFEVMDVCNGQQAVEAFSTKNCDICTGFLIILMDYDMPILNGVEVRPNVK